MKFLGNLLKSGVEVKDDATRHALGATPAAYLQGTPYSSSWNVERAVKDGFERSIWAYRAIHAIADNAARLNMVVREGDPETGDEVDGHPLLVRLNRRANPYERARPFRYRLSAQLLMSKQGAYIEVVRTKGGDVAAVHLLPPHRTAPIPDQDDFVKAFRVYMQTGYADVPAENVIWVKNPHPLDPYMGSTAFEPTGLSLDLDFWSRLYNRTFMQNDGRPGGLLNVQGEMDPADEAELKRRFTGGGGPTTAGRTSVINSDGVQFVDTALSPRDAQYVQSRGQTKEDILIGNGVPETVAGNASGRTYDNADAETDVFWKVTMLSHLDTVSAAFDELLGEGERDELFCGYDLSGVPVLGREERALEDHYLALFSAGVISADEFREYTGREPYDRPESQALWIAGAKFPIARGDDVEQGHLVGLASQGTLPPDYEDPEAQDQQQAPPQFGGDGGGGFGSAFGGGGDQGGQDQGGDQAGEPATNGNGRKAEPAFRPVWLDGLAAKRG